MGNNDDDYGWCGCAALFGLVFFGAICYGIYYWLKPTDYVEESKPSVNPVFPD